MRKGRRGKATRRVQADRGCLLDAFLDGRYELSISPKHQKMGLGRILVEGVEELGRKAGMKKVVLTSLKSESSSLCLPLALLPAC